MRFFTRLVAGAALLVLSFAALAQQMNAPASITIDSVVKVQLSGSIPEKSFVSIVKADAAEGTYGEYAYAQQGTVEFRVPSEPGAYELRWLAADPPYPTLTKRAIQLVVPTASVKAPASVKVATAITIEWKGPSGSGEYITLVPADAAEGTYADYEYTSGDAGSITLPGPSEPGRYEVRYLSGGANATLAKQSIDIGDAEFSLEFPASAAAGSTISVSWKGPGNPRDFVTIVAPSAAAKAYDEYTYTEASPLKIAVPEQIGTYEVRYLSADSSRIYLRKPLQVTGVSATISGPSSVEAGAEFKVQWQGPGNDGDYVAVTSVGKPKDYITYTYTRQGNPLELAAPREPGEYELHYLTARTDASLAKQALKVTPAAGVGRLRVVGTAGEGAQGASSKGLAVALILDASGSMLQKLDGVRRIDLARKALDQLVNKGLAEGTPVALRVFGHRKPDACDTELLEPLAALDRQAMSARIAGIEAKNLAKTPIGDSLKAVAEDLAGVEGSAVVVLVTDGEETCQGNPEAAIRQLNAQGYKVTLNIVGFAVGDHALEKQFQQWAELGGGAYFSARNGDALARGVLQSVRRPFALLQGGKRVASGFAGGEPVEVKAGRYQLELDGTTREVEVLADQEVSIQP